MYKWASYGITGKYLVKLTSLLKQTPLLPNYLIRIKIISTFILDNEQGRILTVLFELSD